MLTQNNGGVRGTAKSFVPQALRSRVLLENLVSVVGFLFLFLFFLVATKGRSATLINLRLILNQMTTVLILGLGASLIYTHGNVDFSVGSIMGLTAIAISYACEFAGLWVILPVMVLFPLIWTLLNGFCTVFFNLPPFVTSLCVNYICRGLIQISVETSKVPVPSGILFIDRWGFKLPALVLLILVTAVIMERTKLGQYNKAIGSNALAAEQCGVLVSKYKLYAYVLDAVFIGIAALFSMARTGTVSVTIGSGLELDVLVAMKLGGMMAGRKASILNVVLGCAMVAMLRNGLILINVSDGLIEGIQGVIFLLAVTLSYEKNKRVLE